MNKAELVSKVADKTGFKKKDAEGCSGRSSWNNRGVTGSW